MNRQACRPTPGRYFTATRPQLGRYFTNTRPTLRSLGQLLLPSSIFAALLRVLVLISRLFYFLSSLRRGDQSTVFCIVSTERRFQWLSSFFGLAMFFPRHRFYIRPSLLSDVAAFGDCCFRRLVILGEQKMI